MQKVNHDFQLANKEMSSGNVHLMQTCSRNIIARPLTTLINLSGQKGNFPSKLKYAKIIPVYKDGDESEPCNYRPIPLVPIFNRIFKKILYNRLKYFFFNKGTLRHSHYLNKFTVPLSIHICRLFLSPWA